MDTKAQTAGLTLFSVSAEDLELIDAEVYRRGLIVSAKTTRSRGFRFNGKFYAYYHDAADGARKLIIAERNRAMRLAASV
jgi:hypothetical protein